MNKLIMQEKQAQFGHHKEQDHHKKAPWNRDLAQKKEEESAKINMEIDNIIN